MLTSKHSMLVGFGDALYKWVLGLCSEMHKSFSC